MDSTSITPPSYCMANETCAQLLLSFGRSPPAPPTRSDSLHPPPSYDGEIVVMHPREYVLARYRAFVAFFGFDGHKMRLFDFLVAEYSAFASISPPANATLRFKQHVQNLVNSALFVIREKCHHYNVDCDMLLSEVERLGHVNFTE